MVDPRTDIRESDQHPDLDAMLADWPRIAALAHRGFVLQGRGALVVEVWPNGPRYTYHAGGSCDCCREAVGSYDPDEQVVVVVRRAESERVYVVGGWPSPADMHALASADTTGATVH